MIPDVPPPDPLKTGDRVIYRETGTETDVYPTVAQVLAHTDRMTVKLEHPSWPTYRFVGCGTTAMAISADAGRRASK
jgi:hypothetical protein